MMFVSITFDEVPHLNQPCLTYEYVHTRVILNPSRGEGGGLLPPVANRLFPKDRPAMVC